MPLTEQRTWDDVLLSEWRRTGEWQALEERLDDLDAQERTNGGRGYNPARSNIFAAFDTCPFPPKVAILGQDPYPERKYATGIAFSIPEGYKTFPPSLQNIYKEYCSDLHVTQPTTGNLEKWCEQGVLLWNVVPTCSTGRAGSHHNWYEWEILNEMLVRCLNDEKIVFVFLGAWARKYERMVDVTKNKVIFTSHPSPLGAMAGRNPFIGSRIFTTINDHLNELNKEPINWLLKGSKPLSDKR